MNTPMIETPESPMIESDFPNNKWKFPKYWYFDLLLVLVILIGGYFRLVGIRWDETQHLHPDERFLTMVETDISPVNSVSEYFNTEFSSLNPHNRGHGFYVYGDLPIIVVRYIAEWTGQTGYDQVNVLGRQVSAIFDIFTLLLVYLIGSKLYDKRIGFLASIFFAFSVMQIQISHYFAVDTFLCFFTTLAVYFAVLVYSNHTSSTNKEDGQTNRVRGILETVYTQWSGIGYYLLFGVALGLAMSSKISAAPVAILLPVAVLPWFVKLPKEEKKYWIIPVLRNFMFGAITAFIVFRIFQPYAFSGPGFFGIIPNPKLLENFRELAGQTSGKADFPPALQWARRPATFALENIIRWGMGIPLGILVWSGFLVMAWRMIKRDWGQHIIIWLWTAVYFAWQSQAWNPSMRYMVLVYPTLVNMGAWLIFHLWDKVKDDSEEHHLRGIAIILTVITVVGSGLWAYAFTRIYTRPVTRIEASRWIYQNIPGPINLHIVTSEEVYNQPLPYPEGMQINNENPGLFSFTANATGDVNEIFVYKMVDIYSTSGIKEFNIRLEDAENGLSSGSRVTADFIAKSDYRGDSYLFKLEKPFQVTKGHVYQIILAAPEGGSAFTFYGSAPANESDWDDGLPLRIDNYDGYGGIYPGGLNFQMYWDEDSDKRERFITNLDQADVIFISSNRQWATTVRIPERYPMATLYYRNLLGCPENKDLIWCYSVAQTGMFKGQLGFELVKVFQSDPNLGDFRINDQFAEEAFTVYDHPKVLIFRKTAAYNPVAVRTLFNSVDLTRVVHLPLNEVPMHPQKQKDLLLPENRLIQQQSGGTWYELFNVNNIINTYPAVSAVLWYIVIGLLGLMVFPLVHLAFPGLKDKGYAFSRMTGMLLFALLSWWVGSVGIPVTRLTLVAVLMVIAAINLVLALVQKNELKTFFAEKKNVILIIEGVILLFFLIDLLIRVGNPDLWHPYKGGEKPMDFSYFNAIIKSTTFPPYDPWFAGGYINYYYYGFVIVGMLVKLVGIMPSLAYNLILPTLFSILAVGMFSIIWNITSHSQNPNREITDGEESKEKPSHPWMPFVFGMAGAAGLVLLGNLGTIRMIWQGLQRLAAPGGDILIANVFQRWIWSFRGFVELVKGAKLPFSPGDWYWIPSRAIPAPNDVEPITEFPFFTFLYADMHAHMIALPITILVMGWITGLILGKGHIGGETRLLKLLGIGAVLFTGAMAVGALRPTNTWDFPVYLALSLMCIIYFSFRWKKDQDEFWKDIPILHYFWIRLVLFLAAFAGLSMLLYQPFTNWYGAGYNLIELWKGTTTPFWSYITHWGVFLFFIIAWLSGETIDWMAFTPLRSLSKIRPYLWLVQGLLVLVVLLTILLIYVGAGIAWFVLPLAAWAAVIMFRPDLPDIKRVLLFFIGTGLVLTLFVEVFVLKGDIGRMNTVFKFYLQVWTLFAISAAVSAWWILERINAGRMHWGPVYRSAGSLLLLGAAMFPIFGGIDKITDRYVDTASHSLNGINYMNGSTYEENGHTMQLSEDLDGIRWVLANVKGSPVIVEGNVVEYRWGNRYTINTGLPGVLGWNWHQRQQRAVTPPEWVTDRVVEIGSFYSTTSIPDAISFLQKYRVKYIVVGQLELAIYPLDGLAKFYQLDGVPWKIVYQKANTTILEVNLGY